MLSLAWKDSSIFVRRLTCQLLKQVIWNNHDGRWDVDRLPNEKKLSNGQATRRAQVSLIRDPMRRTRHQRKERNVEKIEGRSKNDRKILMLEVQHACHVC